MTDIERVQLLILRFRARHGFTLPRLSEELAQEGVDASEDCLSLISRGISKDCRYSLGKAMERIAVRLGEVV